MTSYRYSLFASIRTFAACGMFVGVLSGCSGEPSDGDEMASGGSATGGGSGGLSTGGTASGGASGGSATGGASTGGTSSGGAGTGGASSGGQASGGQASGGAGTGGAGASPGSGGDGSGGTGGGDSGFAPCPAAEPCKILPLGDSITFGLSSSGGGYRVELFRLAVTNDHDITFTGTQSPNGPDMVEGQPFPKNHAGISGQTIQQIAGRIPSPDLQEIPHIILLHAGTNDMWNGSAGAPGRLGDLMDALIAGAPDALLVVSSIVPWPGQYENDVQAFNAEVPGLVQERADQGAHVIYVDQFAAFPATGLSNDGIHPNDGGYAAMGEAWYDAIESYLR